MLSQYDKENILNSFPNVKLSYETITHNKVFNSDLILAIPVGIKCFAWFTTFNDNYVCILLEVDNNNKKQIKNIRFITTCFSFSLCYGTLIYGTLFYSMGNPFFSVEDIFLYKGNDFSRENWGNKFLKITEMFKKDIKQVSYNKNFIVFGVPLIIKNSDTIDKLPIDYKLDIIQYRKLNVVGSYQILSIDKFIKGTGENINIKNTNNNININTTIDRNTNTKQSIIFKIKPDVQNDIYHLYCANDEYYGVAGIPDYKTSVTMNKLFRKIKENDDLDKLEESDDEDEFQDSSIDKFVSLEKSQMFECFFNKRFKKWIPIKLVKDINATSIEVVTNAVNRFNTKQTFNYYKK